MSGPRWFLEGCIPASAIVVILDEADGIDPWTAIERGADIVVAISSQDPHTLSGVPFLLAFVWREGLLPGHEPPPPFWVRWNGTELVRGERAA